MVIEERYEKEVRTTTALILENAGLRDILTYGEAIDWFNGNGFLIRISRLNDGFWSAKALNLSSGCQICYESFSWEKTVAECLELACGMLERDRTDGTAYDMEKKPIIK